MFDLVQHARPRRQMTHGDGEAQFVDESPEFDDSIDGSRLTHSSVKFGPTTSSATSARLMRAPKLRTPRYRHQLAAGAFGDASHRLDWSRRFLLLHPVHQKVVFAEARRNSSPRNGATVRAVTSSKSRQRLTGPANRRAVLLDVHPSRFGRLVGQNSKRRSWAVWPDQKYVTVIADTQLGRRCRNASWLKPGLVAHI